MSFLSVSIFFDFYPFFKITYILIYYKIFRHNLSLIHFWILQTSRTSISMYIYRVINCFQQNFLSRLMLNFSPSFLRALTLDRWTAAAAAVALARRDESAGHARAECERARPPERDNADWFSPVLSTALPCRRHTPVLLDLAKLSNKLGAARVLGPVYSYVFCAHVLGTTYIRNSFISGLDRDVSKASKTWDTKGTQKKLISHGHSVVCVRSQLCLPESCLFIGLFLLQKVSEIFPRHSFYTPLREIFLSLSLSIVLSVGLNRFEIGVFYREIS